MRQIIPQALKWTEEEIKIVEERKPVMFHRA